MDFMIIGIFKIIRNCKNIVIDEGLGLVELSKSIKNWVEILQIII